MADHIRSYNQVSTTLPHSKYRRRLTLLQKVLWDDLISWPTYCGLFSIDIEDRAFYHKVEVAEIEEALAKFEFDGKIRCDGEYIWVLEFIQHQSFNPNGLKAAITELLPLTFKTGLASEHYMNLTGTLPEGCMKVPVYQIKSDQTKSDQNRSDQPTAPANVQGTLPEGSPNLSQAPKKTAKPGPPTPKKKTPAKPELPPPSPEALALAEQMETDIKQLEDDGHSFGVGWRRQPVVIARSLDLSKVNLEICGEAWVWGLADKFYGSELLKQMSWAKQPNRWVDLVNKYLARRPNGRQPQLMEYARERG